MIYSQDFATLKLILSVIFIYFRTIGSAPGGAVPERLIYAQTQTDQQGIQDRRAGAARTEQRQSEPAG